MPVSQSIDTPKTSANRIYINDPNSTRPDRVEGDPETFFRQVKYYWWVDARAYNNEEEDTTTGDQILAALTDKQAYALLAKAQRHAAALPEPAWSQKEGAWRRAAEAGIVNGQSPEGLIKRDEVAAILARAGTL